MLFLVVNNLPPDLELWVLFGRLHGRLVPGTASGHDIFCFGEFVLQTFCKCVKFDNASSRRKCHVWIIYMISFSV